VSVTPADERQSTEHGEASGAGRRDETGVPNKAEAGMNSDTEHDGIESVVA
jgi:hypothetical protein